MAFVSSGTGSWVAASSFSVTKPVGSAAGDVIIIGWTSNGAMTGSLQSSGFTGSQQTISTPDGQTAGILVKQLVGTEGSTFSVTNSASANSTGGYFVARYSGVGGSFVAPSCFSTASSNASNTTPVSMAAASFTTTAANVLLATFFAPDVTVSGAAGTFTPPSGFMTEVTAGGAKIPAYLADATQATAGASGTKTATVALSSGSAGWMAWTIALPPPLALTSTLTATTTASATRQAATSATKSASTSESAAVAKATQATRSGSTTESAAVGKAAGAVRSAPTTATPALSKAIGATRAATSAASAAMSKAAASLRTTTTSAAASAAKAVSTARSAASTTAASVFKGASITRSASTAATTLIGKSLSLIRGAVSAVTALLTSASGTQFVYGDIETWNVEPRSSVAQIVGRATDSVIAARPTTSDIFPR